MCPVGKVRLKRREGTTNLLRRRDLADREGATTGPREVRPAGKEGATMKGREEGATCMLRQVPSR